MTDFNEIIERRGTRSIKWDTLEANYGKSDLCSMWVADADFRVAEPILEALRNRVEHGIFGYTMKSDDFYDAIIGWCRRRHGWEIKKEWIVYTPGVVAAINWAVRSLTEPGDKVIVQPPVYYPFFSAIENNGRVLVENSLINDNGHYRMDFEDLISKIDDRTKLLILCSPHNPVSRVWTEEELGMLTDICIKHNIRIVSDEIHSDLIMPGYRHQCTAGISAEAEKITMTCMAPSKTFNVAGLDTAVSIIPDQEMRDAFVGFQQDISVTMGNVFGIEALIAAYNEGEPWLEEQLEYISGNAEYFRNFIDEELPQFKVTELEGTYLIWLDCRSLGMTSEELDRFFVDKAGIVLDHGAMFGKDGAGFMRFNIATPRANLVKALNQLKKAVEVL